jgi:hypothetical protein
MADEMNEGAAYLRALKQATGASSGAAAAPAREPDSLIDNLSMVQGSESFQGAEKRRSPRYKCEGSAQLREEGCDVRTWSTFTDISLNGCYVEAQATYPAGTLLHMKLESNGIRLEIRAKCGSRILTSAWASLSGNIGRKRRPSEIPACQPLASPRHHGTWRHFPTSNHRTNGGCARDYAS